MTLVVAVMSLGPIAASAADVVHHATSVADAATAHANCADHADEGQDPGDAHCALCCLAHSGYANVDGATRVFALVDWAWVKQPVASGPRAPPQRAYGLMRPPRT